MKNNLVKSMVALSAAVDQNGPTIDATSIVATSAQCVMTGTSSGTLKFQASNDTPAQCADSSGKLEPVNWSDISGASVTITGTAGVFFIPKIDCCYQWIRLVFVKNNAAAGTVTANVNAKGF